jgi:hypothetical protein
MLLRLDPFSDFVAIKIRGRRKTAYGQIEFEAVMKTGKTPVALVQLLGKE